MSTKPRPKKKRVRRSAEEARAAILDATDRRLVEAGPDGIRLQDVAAEVGISHTTILHHFGGREHLVDEVVRRRIDVINQDVIDAVADRGVDPTVIGPLLGRLFQAFGPGGHARVVAYLALGNRPNPDIRGLNTVMGVLHQARQLTREPGSPAVSLEDTEFIVQLTNFALFGEAIVGPLFRGEPPDAPDPEARRRFLDGLRRLVERLLGWEPAEDSTSDA